MRRIIAAVLIGVVCFFAGYVSSDLRYMFSTMNTAGVIDWQKARLSFLTELAGGACITEDQMIAAAEARDWAVSVLDKTAGSFGASVETADRVLVIEVTPALPFSKQDGAWFGFDAQGCYVP